MNDDGVFCVILREENYSSGFNFHGEKYKHQPDSKLGYSHMLYRPASGSDHWRLWMTSWRHASSLDQSAPRSRPRPPH